MASILSNKQSMEQPEAASQNPVTTINNIINQILNSANPKQTFDQIVNSSDEIKNDMNLINQYGNGDPKTAFMNYMAATGKQSIGQQIMQKLGLK